MQETEESSLAQVGDLIVLAKELQNTVLDQIGVVKKNVKQTFFGKDLESTECEHPLKSIGYDFSVRVLEGDFVNLEQGTGIVHVAPGHGADDYNLGIKNNVEVVQTVEDDGKYNHHAKGFVGEHVYKVCLLYTSDAADDTP